MNVIQETYVNGVPTRKIEKMKARGLKKAWLICPTPTTGWSRPCVNPSSAVPGSDAWSILCAAFWNMFPIGKKQGFAARLKQIWLQPDDDSARKNAVPLMDDCETK